MTGPETGGERHREELSTPLPGSEAEPTGAETSSRPSWSNSGCANAFAANALGFLFLGRLFYIHPFAGVAAAVAVLAPVLAWRRPRGWRWAAVPLLASVGAAVGLWWDTTLGRPPAASVVGNVRWIVVENLGWMAYVALGIGIYGLILLLLVPSRPLRAFAVLAMIPAMQFVSSWLDYAGGGGKEPLDSDVRQARVVLRNLHDAQVKHHAEHGRYAGALADLPVDSIVPDYLDHVGVELESWASTGYAARASTSRMPEPCTLRARPETEDWADPVCPQPIPYHRLIRWGL